MIANQKVETRVDKPRFSFTWMAKEVIKRQQDDKDTIIVVAGERRNGKSNWALKIIAKFIKEKRKLDPNFEWSWKENFPLTRSMAMDNVENIEEGGFICYDEAGDVMYRGDTLSVMNKKLIKFMSKSGKKQLLTLIVLPDIFLLDPKILNMAHFLVAVPYRFKKICSFAFIFGRNPNTFVKDKFGLEMIVRQFQSKKTKRALRMAQMRGKIKVTVDNEKVEIPYPQDLFAFLRSLPTFLHWHRFTKADKSFEDRYIKNVKNKQLAARDEMNYVKESDFKKLKNRYETLMYNLYVRQGMTYAQLERMHMNEVGKRLVNAQSIRKSIESTAVRVGVNGDA